MLLLLLLLPHASLLRVCADQCTHAWTSLTWRPNSLQRAQGDSEWERLNRVGVELFDRCNALFDSSVVGLGEQKLLQMQEALQLELALVPQRRVDGELARELSLLVGGVSKSLGRVGDTRAMELEPRELAAIQAASVAQLGEQSCVLDPPYTQHAASSVLLNHAAGHGNFRGRLDSAQAWTPAKQKKGEWLQLDAGAVMQVEGVVVGGRSEEAVSAILTPYVTAFQVEASVEGGEKNFFGGAEWFNVLSADTPPSKTFRAVYAPTILPFAAPVKARYLRIRVREWHNGVSVRAGLVVGPTKQAQVMIVLLLVL